MATTTKQTGTVRNKAHKQKKRQPQEKRLALKGSGSLCGSAAQDTGVVNICAVFKPTKLSSFC